LYLVGFVDPVLRARGAWANRRLPRSPGAALRLRDPGWDRAFWVEAAAGVSKMVLCGRHP